MELKDEQWQLLQPLIPAKRKRKPQDGRGRPWREDREVLNGILWILRTGARWKDLPAHYPPYQTCHRRFQLWVKRGVLKKILHTLAEDLKHRGKMDLSECFIDGSFSSAKKGASKSEKPSGARGPRSWQWQTAMVFLSPLVLKLLPGMKANWLKTLSKADSSGNLPEGLLEIEHMIATLSTNR